MSLVFVYGSLKQGFANEHVNAGRRVAGRWRTRERWPMLLLGTGEVPCLVAAPGTGHQVIGELYEVDAQALVRMDRLERVGEAAGYVRIEVAIERCDAQPAAQTEDARAFVYVKPQHAIAPGEPRIGPLAEYLPEHARNFRWQGAE